MRWPEMNSEAREFGYNVRTYEVGDSVACNGPGGRDSRNENFS